MALTCSVSLPKADNTSVSMDRHRKEVCPVRIRVYDFLTARILSTFSLTGYLMPGVFGVPVLQRFCRIA